MNKKAKHIIGLIISLSFLFVCASVSNVSGFQYNQIEQKLEYCAIISEINGDGKAQDAIDWINIEEAIYENRNDLELNNNAAKIAVLDSGFDKATWTHYKSKSYGSSLNLMMYDEEGNIVTQPNARDDSEIHHGTIVMSMLIQTLECNVSLDASITMFMSGGNYPNITVIKQHLQHIIDWNDDHPTTGRYKVISMSFELSSDNFTTEIDTLVNDQDCIIVSASGNQMHIQNKLTKSQAHQEENVRHYPAGNRYVIGVGGFYGYKGFNNNDTYRMSAYTGMTTGDYFFGSKYWQDSGNTYATVHVSAPAYDIDVIYDRNEDGVINSLDKRLATGTSLAAPQVAASAYLASRLRYEMDSSDPLTFTDFFDALMSSCENDQAAQGKTWYQRITWDEVDEPQANLGSTYLFYSRRVGFGSLDVYDLFESLITLS